MELKKLTRDAFLTAIALTIFMVEAQIPALVPIPGVKLGLANIVTVFALFAYGPRDALLILLIRVFLGSVFSGQMTTFFFSLSGGLLCFAVTRLMKKVLSERQIWVAAVIGAVFHNIGQIIVAILITSTPGIIVYLPILLVSGIITGLFTGLCAQFLYGKLKHLGQF